MKFATKAIHVGEEPNLNPGGSGDVVVPIHLTSTFARHEVDIPTGGYEYSRSGNPTRQALESRLAALENARYGLAFASGLAAETTIILALLESGDHIVAFDDLYGGSRRLFSTIFQKHYSIEISYVDATNPENIKSAITDNTRLIWLETPTNPLLKLGHINRISKMANEINAVLVVDNTFMSPFFQNPLELNADIAVHSTTKYLNGHSDSVGGAIMLNDENLYEKIKHVQNAAGAILSPFDCYLVLRGIKTLPVRMRAHENNAIRIADYLENHATVRKVYYPGLSSHPQHELANEQMSGYGGMISFELEGSLETARNFIENLRYFALAESLGGVESLAELPAIMTHASVPEKERRHIGISDSLIRFSVGIEDCADLLEDIDRAFKKVI